LRAKEWVRKIVEAEENRNLEPAGTGSSAPLIYLPGSLRSRMGKVTYLASWTKGTTRLETGVHKALNGTGTQIDWLEWPSTPPILVPRSC
jgi:hypothetical protein